jgi:hypothetical protein
MAEILTTKNGAVGTITISNPTKMNAMSVQMWMDLPKAIRAFDADPEVRVIVIAGVGEKAFVSGADISQFDKLRSSAKTQDDYDNAVADSMVAPVECSKPVIAKIRGFCFGGGGGLGFFRLYFQKFIKCSFLKCLTHYPIATFLIKCCTFSCLTLIKTMLVYYIYNNSTDYSFRYSFS